MSDGIPWREVVRTGLGRAPGYRDGPGHPSGELIEVLGNPEQVLASACHLVVQAAEFVQI